MRRLVLVALLVPTVLAGTARAQQPPRVQVGVPPDGALVTDAPVDDIAGHGNRMYLRGDFRHVGRFTGPGILVDPATGALDPSVVPLNGQISDVEPDGAGGWYVGGTFTISGRRPHANIAHINADGTTDEAFQAAADGIVTALVRSGDRLYLAGGFSAVDGTVRGGVAAVDARTGALLPFNAKQTGTATEMVLGPATATRPARLYVGMRQILALDPATGDPVPGFTSNISADIRALAVDDRRLYVGGNGIAALDPDTGDRDPAFKADPRNLADDPIFSGTVQILVRDGDRLLAGGQFNSLGGASGPLVALNPATGSADRRFRPQVTATAVTPESGDGDASAGTSTTPADVGIFDIARVGGTLWVGGRFTTAGGAPAENLAALDPATGDRVAPQALPYLGGQVNGLAAGAGGRIFLGGNMVIAGAQPATAGLLAIDGTTLAVDPAFRTSITPRGSKSYDPADALNAPLVPGPAHVAFAANHFYGYEHARPRYQPSRVDIPVVDARSGTQVQGLKRVRNLAGVAWLGDELLIARRLSDRVRFPRNLIEVRDPVSGRVRRQFVLPLPGYVTGLYVSGGALYATGSFRRYRASGQRAHLAVIKVDPRTGALDARFDPHARGPVYSAAFTQGRLYLTGLFDRLGGRRRPSFGAVAPASGAVDPRFNPTRRLAAAEGTELFGLPVSVVERYTTYGDERFVDPFTGRVQLTGLAAARDVTAFAPRADGQVVAAQSVDARVGGLDHAELDYVTVFPR